VKILRSGLCVRAQEVLEEVSSVEVLEEVSSVVRLLLRGVVRGGVVSCSSVVACLAEHQRSTSAGARVLLHVRVRVCCWTCDDVRCAMTLEVP
jgi:hypothetical protein